MDWKSVHFDWNRARAFLVAAEEGSFSAAARALGTTQPTLGRQVSALESELNVVLFDRVGKQLVLTPSGHELVEYVRQMSRAASRVSLAASGQAYELDGEVCITASEAISVFLLPPVIKTIRETYPRIYIEIQASDNLSNLSLQEADIALRNVRPTHPELIGKKICDLSARLYATPNYLDALGSPLKIEHINKAHFLGCNRSNEAIQPLNSLGLHLTLDSLPVISQNLLVQWELTKSGVGMGMMMETIGDREPLVKRVLPDSDAIAFPIWLVAHRQLKNSRRIRVVFDLLADYLSGLAQNSLAAETVS